MLCVWMKGMYNREDGTLVERIWGMWESGREEMEIGGGWRKGEVSGHWADWPQGTSLHNPQTTYDRA